MGEHITEFDHIEAHPFDAYGCATGRTCTRMVIEDGDGVECGLPPNHPVHVQPTALIDRDGALWRCFSGIWYRREASGGYGACRGTRTMLDRDFGPMAHPSALAAGGESDV